MNSQLRIYVRVINAARAQLAQVQSQVAGVGAATARASAQANGFHAALLGSTGRLTAWGKNVQWAGRQLEYNFTLPLVLAGAAAVHFSNQNEAAFTRLIKVYGDGSQSTKQVTDETNALRRSFVALSNIMGIAQADVINIGADWAAAGASGASLAKYTRLTAEAMILGEMSAKDTTQALVAISAQYKLNADQLKDTIGILNMVENQTGVSFSGLVQGFSKAAGFARVAGVDVRHLAAMIAAISPAAGSAAQAGNALKTIFSRLLQPTSDAVDLFRAVGIEIKSSTWQNQNANDRLITLAASTKNLTQNQKAQLDTLVASRYQISRFSVLLDALNDKQSYYWRALNSTSSAQKVAAQYSYELGKVLSSQPKAFEILKVRMQNALTQAITPMIPAILSLITAFTTLADKFAKLNPSTQKAIVFGLAFLAVLGPMIRYIGALGILFGYLGGIVAKVVVLFTRFNPAMLLAIGRVTGLTYVLGLLRVAFSLVADGVIYLAAVMVRALAGPLRAVAASVSAFASGALAALGTVLSLLLGQLATLATTLVAGLGAALAAGWTRILAVIQGITAAFGRAFVVLWEGIQATVLAVTSAFGEAFAAVWLAIQTAIMEITVAAGTGLTGIWTAVWTGIRGVTAALGEGILIVVRTLMTEVAVVVQAAGAITTRIWIAMMGAMQAISVAGYKAIFFVTEAFGTAISFLWRGIAVAIEVTWMALMNLLYSSGIWTRVFSGVAAGVGGIGRIMVGGLARLGATLVAFVPKLLTSPWTLAFAAVVALIGKFHNQIGSLFSKMISGIISVFHMLPQGIQNAFLAVIRVISSAVKSVRDWLGEMSPFKRHSPSLVDNVNKGTKVITSHYKAMSKNSVPHIDSTTQTLQNFKAATADASSAQAAQGFATQRAQVLQAAPNAGPAYDATVAAIQRLEKTFPTAEAGIARQKAVVDQWKASLDSADKALDAANTKLNTLKDIASKASDVLDASKDKLKAFADSPIAGMQALDDQIFANTLSTNKLQLQLLQLEDAGKAPEQLADKFSKLQGDIETLRGQAKDLRSAGAGSDVLGPINDQITAMQDAAKATQDQASQYSDLQAQLAALQRQGQELDLTKSIQFDPLTRQIEQLVNTTKELPFDQIIAGIKATQVQVNKNQAVFDTATAAVNRQQVAVDKLQAVRDGISSRYDIENDKLTKLNDAYQANVDKVNSMKDALSSFASAADQAASKQSQLSNAMSNFNAGGAGDFAIPGSDSFKLANDPGNGTSDINKLADQWEKEAEKAFKGISLIQPFKDMFNAAIKWVNDHTGGLATKLIDGFKANWKALIAGGAIGFAIGGPFGAAIGAALMLGLSKVPWKKVAGAISDFFTNNKAGQGIASFGKSVGDAFAHIGHALGTAWHYFMVFAQALWKLIGPDIVKIFGSLGKVFSEVGKAFAEVWKSLKPALSELGHLFMVLWNFIKPVVGLIGILLLGAIKIVFSVLSHSLLPVIRLLATLFKFVGNVIADVVGFISDLFTGRFGKAISWIGKLFHDVFFGIYHTIRGAWDLIYGIVSGIVSGIVNFFKWLYDVLLGHSIIPDIVNGIIAFFTTLWHVAEAIWRALGAAIQWVWDNILLPIWHAFEWAWSTILKPVLDLMLSVFKFVWGLIGDYVSFAWAIIKAIFSAYVWAWSNVLWPVLKFMGSVFAAIWGGIGSSISWVWNKVIMPVWQGMIAFWNAFLWPVLKTMGSVFATIWQGIGTSIKWVYDNVILKVYNALVWAYDTIIKKMLNSLINGFATIFNGVGDVVAIGINIAIRALDALIGGVNWVLRHIGIKGQIGEIKTVGHPHWTPPQLAAGGPVPIGEVGSGFRTNGIRAIVGEGNPSYPEYVIPTDPKHRNRARMLAEEANSRLFAAGGKLPESPDIPAVNLPGVNPGKPTYTGQQQGIDIGKPGFLDRLSGAADAIVDKAKQAAGYIRKGVVTAALAPFLAAFDQANKLTPKDVMGINAQAWMNKEKNDFYNWAKGDKVNKDYGPNWEGKPPAGFSSWEQWANQGNFTGALGQNAYQEIIQYARRGPAFSQALVGLDRGGSSYHESGNAVDFSGGNLDAMAEFWWQVKSSLLEEIHSPRWFAKNGRDVGAGFYGDGIVSQHYNHVHIAATKAAMDRLLSADIGIGVTGSALDSRNLGKRMASSLYGWDDSQFASLDALWSRESGWRWNAANASGAYGIPQALPGDKMSSAGSDWRTNPATQIRWGLGYIHDRYGNPANAWNQWMSRGGSPYGNWYGGGGKLPTYPNAARGGIVNPRPGGTLVRVGEAGQKEKITPLPRNGKADGGTELHFHGDLSFPNVRDGNDAYEFIQNLKSMASK